MKNPRKLEKIVNNPTIELRRGGVKSDGEVTVAINTTHYCKTLEFINALDVRLREILNKALGGLYVVDKNNVRVVILGGNRRKGMVSVEFDIVSKLLPETIEKNLHEAGFLYGFEPSLT